MSTFATITPESNSGGLSTPKIVLSYQTDTPTVDVEFYDSGTNSAGGTYSLTRYPMAIATDITKDQIKQGVYIEMLVYNKATNKQNNNNTSSGYKVPSPRIKGINPLGDKRTRGGEHTINGGGSHVLFGADRPNHYKVSSQNEVLPIWEYLKNRHRIESIRYRDITNDELYIQCLIPIQGARAHGKRAENPHGYSARYRPYYFTFRYTMRDKKSKQRIVGAESNKIKLTHADHPFNFVEFESSFHNQAVNNINPLFDLRKMECQRETKT